MKITSADHKSHFRWPWKSLPLCLKVTSVSLESHFRCAWKSLPLTIKVTSADHKSHFRCAWKSAQVTFVVLKSHLKSLPLCLVSEGGISILSHWKEEFLRFEQNFPSLLFFHPKMYENRITFDFPHICSYGVLNRRFQPNGNEFWKSKRIRGTYIHAGVKQNKPELSSCSVGWDLSATPRKGKREKGKRKTENIRSNSGSSLALLRWAAKNI